MPDRPDLHCTCPDVPAHDPCGFATPAGALVPRLGLKLDNDGPYESEHAPLTAIFDKDVRYLLLRFSTAWTIVGNA